MRSLVMNKKGFSLVELMVVVAIIGILAAIAVPNFQKFTAKSKQSEAKAELAALYSAERAFAAEWNTFFEDFRNIGYQPTGDLRYNHGFNSATATCPTNYNGTGSGVALAGAKATVFATSSTSVCLQGGTTAAGGTTAVNAVSCRLITSPVDPTSGITAGTVNTATTFIAMAAGDIDGDATLDTWTVNEAKEMKNTIDDLNN